MDSGPYPLWGLLIFVLLLAIDFICCALHAAVDALTESELNGPDDEEEGREHESRREKPEDRRAEEQTARIRALNDEPKEMVRTARFWQATASCAGTLVLVGMVCPNVWLVGVIAASVLYVFGWAVPNYIGKKYRLRFARAVLGTWLVLSGIAHPFTAVLSAAAGLFARLAGADPSKLSDEVTEDEIISMVNEGHEQGTVDEDEAEMIRNVFELDEKQAQDVMTHRGHIIGIEGRTRLNDAIRLMVASPNSRFPVYDESIDNILGALYLKDAMAFHMKEEYNDWYVKDIPDLLREIRFVPETRRIDDLFSDMQDHQQQMAIVVDEYGETSGLITMEDILEEIVGNIFDEYDRVERYIIPLPAGVWRMNGMAQLSDVCEALGTEDDEDYDTLNGYLTARLDHVPEESDVGAVIEDPESGCRFRIESVKDNTIQWAAVSKMEKQG